MPTKRKSKQREPNAILVWGKGDKQEAMKNFSLKT
jgi:hypothetical protein